jgi:hypothetical protein
VVIKIAMHFLALDLGIRHVFKNTRHILSMHKGFLKSVELREKPKALTLISFFKFLGN